MNLFNSELLPDWIDWWHKQDTRLTFCQIMFENKYEVVKIYENIRRILLQIEEQKN